MALSIPLKYCLLTKDHTRLMAQQDSLGSGKWFSYVVGTNMHDVPPSRSSTFHHAGCGGAGRLHLEKFTPSTQPRYTRQMMIASHVRHASRVKLKHRFYGPVSYICYQGQADILVSNVVFPSNLGLHHHAIAVTSISSERSSGSLAT